ncbi:squalene/phytoene synthase family protein [Sphingomonas sp.]|jgi:phytoene synthase|uniref:squalene/phytoene synthase family protein n=1 Tax=Sphingomonas sp. TaxID=28214 RepID=UPI002E360041|nr:squalene/phytoene synthase family protein [Sphingomonas sp.]HEX4693508.1 squalene/phytoene synthase family protein [Sphingomonas sp.]
MVNVAVTSIDDPQLALVLSYAPAPRRAGLRALLALDAALGQVLRTTREPMIGQMRLAWWREALTRLDAAPPPGEPVLQALADDVMPLGVTGAALATMIDGWEPLLGELGEAAIADHGRWRGRVLFVQAGRLLDVGDGDPVEMAGEGWALADLATHFSDPALAAKARDVAMPLLAKAAGRRWSRNARALGALAHIARLDLAGPATPWRVARLGWHRITGR